MSESSFLYKTGSVAVTSETSGGPLTVKGTKESKAGTPGGHSAAEQRRFFRSPEERQVAPKGVTVTTAKQTSMVKYGGVHKRSRSLDLMRNRMQS